MARDGFERAGDPRGGNESRPPTAELRAMRELRIHGRGGQGAVIASKLLASALFLEGRSVQSFPAFGVGRRGAPVTGYQ